MGGSPLVVGINVHTKYLHLDHGGLLLHAHYSFCKECVDKDYVEMGNVLSEGGYGQKEGTETFHSAFEETSEHPLSPRSASHGATRLRTPPPPTSPRFSGKGSGKGSPSSSKAVRSPTPTECPGCRSGHSRHSPTCPHSTIAKTIAKEKNIAEQPIAKKKTKKTIDKTLGTPKLSKFFPP